MSKHLVSLVYRKKIGSMMRKAVLSYMADRANDDGTGIWCSKATIANEIEASRQGVITTIKSLVDDGLLVEDGQRKCSNGFTIEYRIDVKKLAGLPFVTGKNMDGSKSVPVKEVDVAPSTTFTPPVSPVDTNLPEPPLEPSNTSDGFEEAWKLYNSTKLKVGQTKKSAKAQWPKAVKRAGSPERLLKAIETEVAKRRSPKGFVSSLPDMFRWLRDDRWQDAEREAKPVPTQSTPAPELSDLERAFDYLARTGDWIGARFGYPLHPNRSDAGYPADLYVRFSITNPAKLGAAA